MSRTLKLILIAAIAEMLLVGTAVLAWQHGLLPSLPPVGTRHRFPWLLFFSPAWLGIGSLYAGRRLNSDSPRLSDSHRRYLEGGLKGAAIVIAGLVTFMTYAVVFSAPLDRVLFTRGLVVFTGVWFTTQGNFAAKLDPPSGAGAPPAAVWTRTLLRFGWIMVALGLVLVVCALILTPSQLMPVLLAVVVLGSAMEIAYRRMTRPQQHA